MNGSAFKVFYDDAVQRGLTMAQLAAEIGTSEAKLYRDRAKLRADGYNLPNLPRKPAEKPGAPQDRRVHFVIPDTQARPGVPTDHLLWIGNYIVDRRPDVVIHLGDHADMPSLSSYDKGKRSFEGRRYTADIDAANEAFSILNDPVRLELAKRKSWRLERHILLGNHEYRIERAVECTAELEGALKLEHLNYQSLGYDVHPFLKPVIIDGVAYAHFFANPLSGKPYGGTVYNKLAKLGRSFTQGHVQTLEYGTRYLATGEQQNGLVAGACYLHDESYKGPQGNHHWRGVIVKHEVRNGAYDPMFVSLDFLCRKYEGVSLSKFMRRLVAVS